MMMDRLRVCPRGALLGLAIAACLAGCGADDATAPAAATPPAIAAPGEESPAASAAAKRLAAVLDAQPEEIKARYAARHPQETLLFFGIEPGMTVVEADPGGGWYSRILLSYLGGDGTLIGADYPMGVYELFDYYSDAELAEKASWVERWPVDIGGGRDGAATALAYPLGAIPSTWDGAVDAVLFVRVLHNLADFEDEGGYLGSALAEAYRVLKPGGVVGVVQHQGPETHADAWASGANGYLKKSFVVARFEEAGFVLDGESSINENPRDTPSEAESVWRLAPTLDTPDDPKLAAAYEAIGESHRMTLRFRKPAAP